jgi:3D (Asp-Asp-Asp) domain-containing protein
MLRSCTIALALVLAAAGCTPRTEARQSSPRPEPPPPPRLLSFEATAYSIEGITADGTRAREGVVAADPRVIPLGSHIRIHGAGRYDGAYVVEDTGREIKGREIDVYLRNDAEAKRFGRKQVRVEILERGEGRDGKAENPRR